MHTPFLPTNLARDERLKSCTIEVPVQGHISHLLVGRILCFLNLETLPMYAEAFSRRLASLKISAKKK